MISQEKTEIQVNSKSAETLKEHYHKLPTNLDISKASTDSSHQGDILLAIRDFEKTLKLNKEALKKELQEAIKKELQEEFEAKLQKLENKTNELENEKDELKTKIKELEKRVRKLELLVMKNNTNLEFIANRDTLKSIVLLFAINEEIEKYTNAIISNADGSCQ